MTDSKPVTKELAVTLWERVLADSPGFGPARAAAFVADMLDVSAVDIFTAVGEDRWREAGAEHDRRNAG